MMRFLLLLSAVLLTACSDGGFSDLDQAMADARNRPRGKIEPLPVYSPPEHFNYRAMALRSPFVPPLVLTDEGRLSGTAATAPDQNRPKEPLEYFPVKALVMVGTLAKDGVSWALITDVNGRIHRLRVGNYLGKNYGRIKAIGATEVEIMETVPDGVGGWISRPRTLTMNEE